ncbi:unnamed protein product [[Candida] boidinii]|nr:unnamed protein product [[Candida] boidinii]
MFKSSSIIFKSDASGDGKSDSSSGTSLKGATAPMATVLDTAGSMHFKFNAIPSFKIFDPRGLKSTETNVEYSELNSLGSSSSGMTIVEDLDFKRESVVPTV